MAFASSKFDLSKDTAKVKFMLEKHSLAQIIAEVVAVVDVSGSMDSLFQRGAVQESLQRVVPVALNFDDNGELPTYIFSSEFEQTATPITSANYADYVRAEILNPGSSVLWHGTKLAPVLLAVAEELGFYQAPIAAKASGMLGRLFGAKPESASPGKFVQHSISKLPAIVYVFTDGENDDPAQASQVLENLARANSEIYFNFIGIGSAGFRFLTRVADDLPNVGFAKIVDIARVGAGDEIYEFLIPAELVEWLKAFVK